MDDIETRFVSSLDQAKMARTNEASGRRLACSISFSVAKMPEVGHGDELWFCVYLRSDVCVCIYLNLSGIATWMLLLLKKRSFILPRRVEAIAIRLEAIAWSSEFC